MPFGSYVHYHGGNLLKWYGAERAERMFAHRAFLDAGVARGRLVGLPVRAVRAAAGDAELRHPARLDGA